MDEKLWVAWIAANGRSFYRKPRRVYPFGEIEDTLWHRNGNDFIGVNDRGFTHKPTGGFTYVSSDKNAVALVIESAESVFDSIARSWGLSDIAPRR